MRGQSRLQRKGGCGHSHSTPEAAHGAKSFNFDAGTPCGREVCTRHMLPGTCVSLNTPWLGGGSVVLQQRAPSQRSGPTIRRGASAYWGSAGLPNKGAWGWLRYYSTGQLGISVRDPLFQGRYHVPLTTGHWQFRPCLPVLKRQSSASGCLACSYCLLHPIPTPTTTGQVSGPVRSRAARTNVHTYSRHSLSAVLETDHMQGFGPGVLCPRLQRLHLPPSLGLGSAGRSCTRPLNGPRYICAQQLHSNNCR